MAGIYGMLGLADNDRSYLNTIGQEVVYDAARLYLQQHNAEVTRAYAAFVETTTTAFKERYKLPGGGRLQRRGGMAQSGAVSVVGQWDVAYPLESFGAQFAADRKSASYMTVEQFNNELETIRIQDINTRRFEILRALMNNTARTFVDEWPGGGGTLSIVPLANQDGTLYPPILGSETEQQRQHYITSGYAASAISDTNNPYFTLRDGLEAVFGAPQGFGNIACMINNAQAARTEALTDFVPIEDIGIQLGDDDSRPRGIPAGLPGRAIGRVSGAWVVEWRWVPANYIVAVNLDAPPPLKERIHPEFTGLGSGLQLIAEDEKYPIESSHYEDDFGFGVGNRLNGMVMELTTDATYDIPAAYA